MRIDHLYLKNYRCFDSLSVGLHPQLTVLVAPNGQGKTTILDAIKVALWPYATGFDLGSTTKDVTSILIDDVRREQTQSYDMEWRLPTNIRAEGRLIVQQSIADEAIDKPATDSEKKAFDDTTALQEGVPWQVNRYRDSVKKGTKTKDSLIPGTLSPNAAAKVLERRIFSDRKGSPDDLPMLGYYGTGRLWAQKRLTALHTDADPETQSRTFGYRDCLDSASSYKHFVTWFSRIHRAYLQARIRNLEKRLPQTVNIPDGLIAPLRAVQQAVDKLLKAHTGWHELEYSAEYNELVLHHEQHGILKVGQLSDGIRNMLALVGDIAYRCYKLNAHLGETAPQLTHGIVIIDEVDMHLHPSWQQTVLSDLCGAFPSLQFIVTTHSPQVVSTVKRENIRMIFQNATGQWEAQQPSQEVVGIESAMALNDVMGVNPVPPVKEAKWLKDYIAKIENGTHEDSQGIQLRSNLVQLYGPNHPVILDADRLIRFQAFKLRRKSTSRD